MLNRELPLVVAGFNRCLKFSVQRSKLSSFLSEVRLWLKLIYLYEDSTAGITVLTPQTLLSVHLCLNDLLLFQLCLSATVFCQIFRAFRTSDLLRFSYFFAAIREH